MVSMITMPNAAAIGDSRSACPTISDRVYGANTSSFSQLPVLEWCLPWVMRQEWNGTNRREWHIVPTMVLAVSLSENP